MFFFAGAGLSQPVWDKLDRVAEQDCGERIRMLTGLGMTETAPFAICANAHEVKSGHIGLPAPGVELKLVPSGDKQEVRYRGPNVTPGYWRAPEQTAECFDDEGFYCSGDAAKPMDPAHPELGFMFDGRIAEDFKLVDRHLRLGRAAAREGHRRRRPDRAGRRRRRHQPRRDRHPDLPAPRRLPRARRAAGRTRRRSSCSATPKVRAFLQRLVDSLHASGTGSATRVARALVLAEPPSIDRGEITDKGSINQRAVLTHRAADVERLYLGRDRDVLVPRAR